MISLRKTEWSVLSDEVLVKEAAEGGVGAFEEIVRRYRRRLFNFFRTRLRDRGVAEDAVQETLAIAHSRLAEFRGESKFSTFLLGIANNRCRTTRRSDNRCKRSSIQFFGTSNDLPQVSGGPSLEEVLEWREELVRVLDAIECLPEKYSRALLLHTVEGLSLAEIETRTGVSEDTLKTHVFRARKVLRGESPW